MVSIDQSRCLLEREEMIEWLHHHDAAGFGPVLGLFLRSTCALNERAQEYFPRAFRERFGFGFEEWDALMAGTFIPLLEIHNEIRSFLMGVLAAAGDPF